MKKTKISQNQPKISSFFTKPKLQLKSPNEKNINTNVIFEDIENGSIPKLDPIENNHITDNSFKGTIRVKPLRSLQEPIKNSNTKRKRLQGSIDLTCDDLYIKNDLSTIQENNINKANVKSNDCNDILQTKKMKLDIKHVDVLSECKKDISLPNKNVSKVVVKSSPEKITQEIDPLEYSFVDLDLDEFYSDMYENTLDLSQWQRCIIDSIVRNDSHVKLKLKSAVDNKSSFCILEDFWKDAIIKNGDIISVKAIKFENDEFHITNNGGFLVLYPDNLITGTEIVGSLFCMRKTILQNSFRGIDGDNKNMIIGTLIHELVQSCLIKGHRCLRDVHNECDTMLEKMEYISMLFDANMTTSDALEEMKKITPYIAEFIETFVKLPNKTLKKNQSKDHNAWKGHIDKVIDIEENIWSPKLGVSGRIDITASVTIHRQNQNKNEKLIMPLELKTGRPTGSVEHRGQVMLYTMLMSEISDEKGQFTDVNDGLLLYLRGAVNIQQITANYSEKKDLIMLRNQLAYYTDVWKADIDNSSSESCNEVEDKCSDSSVTLPDPINHHSACKKCPYLTICSIYLSENTTMKLSADHLLMKLKNNAIGHLTPEEIKYFFHWCKLIKLEDNEKVNIHKKDIWNLTPLEREKRGKCLCNMIVSTITSKDNQFEHKFKRSAIKDFAVKDLRQSQFVVGVYVIISSNTKYAETTGFISDINNDSISILLNKNLSLRNTMSSIYSIDGYDTHTLVVYNFTNLGILMDNTENSNKLRRIIISRQKSETDGKLSKNILQIGKGILSKLNPIQQRAVLKALAAQDYILIRGMPGTGKTQTLAALVELLVALNMTVIITSQTHSAVDTVLLRLKDSKLKMLRLGSQSRVHPDLQHITESVLTQHCTSTQHLQDVYDNINVVGVTCLGSNHALLSKKTFDVCIVDESTQVLQCSILRPLFAAKKFVLVGDPDQLPPIVKNNKAKLFGMDESLFSRLDGLGSTISLTLQYRMNKTIMDLANSLTYDDQLLCANDNVANSTLQYNTENLDTSNGDNLWLDRCLSKSLNDAVAVVDTGNTYKKCREYHNEKTNDNIYSNICEAALIQHIINALSKGGVSKKQIGIIAPYREQVLLLQKHIKFKSDVSDDDNSDYADPYGDTESDVDIDNIEINTVDQYQGRDKDIIIYSCTKTWNEDKTVFFSKENQILEDKRRLTVAITRAKYKLIIVGDVTSLKSYKPFRELFDIAEKKLKNVKLSNENSLFSWDKVTNIIS